MKLFERVLVAVGEGSEGLDLIRYAHLVGGVLGRAEFCFVHVLGWPARLPSTAEPTTHSQALRQLEDNVAKHFGDGRVRCLVLHGSVVDRLLECASEIEADLILLGHNSQHGGRRSLARRLAMQAHGSVWMKPANSGTSIHRVLAAIDYSEASAYALSVAGHIAQRAGSTECRALHVYLNEATAGIEEYQSSDRARERETFDRFTAPLDTATVDVQPVLMEGAGVAEALHALAEHEPPDLIVMGSRGRSRSASTLLGSESEHVLMQSAIPVLIARRRGERVSLLQSLADRNFHLQEPPRFG